ncbi:MAG: hypothetical protein AOA66_0336 [Candidatus Bathyarchaeota archaeon BA2]|nr:MAG: hypothetical protein AOA66_0336 [Candidatus Bathyarchaeota archaeon BA2]
MQDLRLAKLRLKERDLTLVIVKEGKVIFETKPQGISDFLQAIEKFGKRLVASSVADKIVGAAAAMLCAYSEVASVFAVTISEKGIKVLESNDIFYQFEFCVPKILNYDRTDICPFEKLAAGSRDPKEAYVKLKSFAESSIQ